MSTLTVRDTPQTSALAVANDQGFWSENQLASLRQIGVEGATNGDLAVFLNFAQRTGLDPFARQIYMISRNDRNSSSGKKWTIQASIDGLRIVAQRSGEYAGQVGPEWCGEDGVWRDVWLKPGAPVAARVGVLRRGFSQPLYAVALLSEYAQSYNGKLGGLWATKPAVMIAKCAEALALRKAFPMDLSGIYTAEEMSQADVVSVQEAPTAQPAAVQASTVRPAAARRGAREEAPAAVKGRDWFGDVEAAQDTKTLRQIYNDAREAGLNDNELAARITEKGTALTDASAEEIMDAEIVEPTPLDAEADAAWIAGNTA